MKSERISRLLSSTTPAKAYLIENPLALRYLCATNIDAARLLIYGDKAYFITDFRYITAARARLADDGIEVVLDKEGAFGELLAKLGVKHIEVEAKYQTCAAMERLKAYDAVVSATGELDRILGDMRMVKDDCELQCIRAAQEITDRAFTHILNYIKVGVTERDIAMQLEFFMRKNGADGVSFDIIAVSGENSACPHGVPTLKKLCFGEFLTLDFGCKVNGYCSDMTRTVAIGRADDDMRRVYDIVLLSQLKALDKIGEGVLCREVDAAARDCISRAGYADCFGHATGHGVGLFIHEPPRISMKNSEPLKNGEVITCEPGIYIENRFGVRIEDMAVVREGGCENLTKSDKSLIIV